jgi:serine protease Do
LSTISDLQSAIGGVAERVGPAVVGFGRGYGRGSGIVVAADEVLTNAHNLKSEEVTVRFADGRRETGRVTGSDPTFDVAVVEVDTAGVEPVEWDPAAGADAGIGLPVVALANPGGRGLRATLGFVSATEQSFRGPRGRRVTGCLEHTAPLPRGSGGGPLVDASGGLLGLNTIRLEGGLILAVPADERLAERAGRLARGETPSTVRLGVAIAPPYVARRLRRAVGLPERDGVLVRSVGEDSPSERAGIAKGDLIVAAGEAEVTSIDGLYRVLDALAPGSELELGLLRGTEERTVTVKFDETREEAAR